jgi:hypothetical protein
VIDIDRYLWLERPIHLRIFKMVGKFNEADPIEFALAIAYKTIDLG